jgi:hypothetical protein
MSYKGKYRVRNKEKYKGDVTNVVYRSMWERYCFKWCDQNSSVEKWAAERVVVPYLYEVDGRAHRYFVDLWIKFTNGDTYLIEVKPDKETRPPEFSGRRTKRYLQESLTYIKNQNKWKAAEEFAADRGWKFAVWTEHTLEKMGIKPKSTKRLKPLRSKK